MEELLKGNDGISSTLYMDLLPHNSYLRDSHVVTNVPIINSPVQFQGNPDRNSGLFQKLIQGDRLNCETLRLFNYKNRK